MANTQKIFSKKGVVAHQEDKSSSLMLMVGSVSFEYKKSRHSTGLILKHDRLLRFVKHY